MTAIAVAYRVHNIAAQSHQRSVFPLQIQGNRSDLETTLDPGFLLPIRALVVTRCDAFRAVHRSGENDNGKCRNNCRSF